MNSSSADQFYSTQFLRFVAAFLVVLLHITEAVVHRVPGFEGREFWGNGAVGVDIFFVISGFVMAVSVGRKGSSYRGGAASWDFLSRRIVRIVPLYWFYTFAKVVLVLALPSLALRTVIEWPHLVQSLFFIPSQAPWGLVQPVLPVGWTLSFEMLFYLIFACALLIGRSIEIVCALSFSVIFLAGVLFPDWDVFRFYSRSLIFEFLLGMVVARFADRRAGMLRGVGSLVLGVFLVALGDSDAPKYRLLTWGIGAALLLYGLMCLELQPVIRQWFCKVKVLGDISYSTYLSHTFVVPLVIVLLCKVEVFSLYVIVPSVLVAVLAVSFASYYWVERPLVALAGACLLRGKSSKSVRSVTDNPSNQSSPGAQGSSS